jgi:FMN phosphatase YigB (HAD superfamily)
MAIKNIIFDLGRVLINWDIQGFAESYTNNKDLQSKIGKLFSSEPWLKLDKGTISEEELEIEYSSNT